MKLLGLSLSACVRDIATGLIPIDMVHHVVTRCSPSNEEDVAAIIADYLKGPWRSVEVPARCLHVFMELRNSHRIQWVTHWEKNPVCGSVIWLPYPDESDDFKIIGHMVDGLIRNTIEQGAIAKN